MDNNYNVKLDVLSEIVGNISLNNFIILKAAGITIMRDFDEMTDMEKTKLIDAITYQEYSQPPAQGKEG